MPNAHPLAKVTAGGRRPGCEFPPRRTAMAHTVIRFIYVKFDDSWQRDAPDVTYVAAREGARLAVIREAPTGALDTYFFVMREPGARVLVSYDHNLVFVPADCEKRVQGDATECGREPVP
jgi:hypothetical protein